MISLASLEEKNRPKRASGMPIAKALLKKGLEKGQKLGAAHFKTLRDAAIKETSSGVYLTKNFVDLIYYPQILALSSQIEELHNFLNSELTSRASYVLSMITLASLVPILLLLSILSTAYQIRKLNKLKTSLLECEEDLATIRAQLRSSPKSGTINISQQ